MANPWDNDPVVSSPAATATPTNSNAPWESDPVVASPKNIDPASVHQMVQSNQPPPSPQPQEGGSAQQPTPFPQALDTGMGMPVSKMMAPQAPGTPTPVVSAATRGHYVDAINNGTASSPADYAQQAIPAAANAINPQPQSPASKPWINSIIHGVYLGLQENAQNAKQTGQLVSGQTPDPASILSPEDAQKLSNYRFSLTPDMDKILTKTAAGIAKSYPEMGGAVIGGGLGALAPGLEPITVPAGAAVGAAAVHAALHIAPMYSDALKQTNGDSDKAWSIAKQKMSLEAPMTGLSYAAFEAAPFQSVVKNMTVKIAAQPVISTAQTVAGNVQEGKPALQGTGQAAVEAVAGVAPLLIAHAGLEKTLTYIANNLHPDLKTLVGKATGKDPSTVTPQDIDQATAQAGQNSGMPHPKDFTDVSKVMYGNESGKSGLQNVYKEAGIPPVQIFDDAQHDPSIAADIAAGKIPTAYADKIDQNDIGAPKPPPGNPPVVGSKQLIGGGTVDHIEHAPGTEEFAQHAASYPQTFEGIHQAAKDFVIQKGQETGNEHLVSLNDNGEATHHVEGSSAGVAIPESLKSELNNPDNKITLVHNHPYPVGVGPKDISFLGRPGAQAIAAHTPSGETSTAALTDNMKQAISWLAPDHSKELLLDVGTKGFNEASNILKEYGQKNNMETGKGSPIAQVHNEIFNKAMAQAGVTDYKYTDDHSSVLPKDVYNDILNKTADTIKERLASYDIKNEQPGRILGRGGSISELSAGRENTGISGTEPGNNVSGSGASGTNDGQGNQPPNGQEPPVSGELPNRSPEGASTTINPLAHILNPAGLSESARDMATALRQSSGPAAHETALAQEDLRPFVKDTNKMSEDEQLALINYMENRSKGGEIPDTKLQSLADKIRDIYAQMADKVQQAFPDVGLREDYFTHQYEDESEAKKFFSDFVSKQGSERNLQERVYPTLSEAIAAGLKPKTTNPIETVMNYVSNMNNLIAAQRGVELAQNFGVADYFEKGQQPEGWVPLNGNLNEKGGKVLYAPEDAARVYNNDISEKATGPLGSILDAVQQTTNFANKLVLGLSGYHFTATTMASMASDIGRALTGGTLTERAGDVLKAITPLSNTIKGGDVVGAYLGREELSPGMQQALDLAIKNNAIAVKQQDYWKAGPAKDFVDSFRAGTIGKDAAEVVSNIKEHPITGTLKAIVDGVGSTMDTIAKPLFDTYIPRIKNAALIDEIHDWLQKNPDADEKTTDRAVQDIGNSIDNRFGKMMRDNLFWHQYTRQTLQTALLSYSWVTGAARMLKGIPDTAMTIMGKQGLSSNARYLMGMAMTYAVVNGVRIYLGTGQAPKDWKDLIYPKTGGTTAQGKPEREILPSHIGQFTNYLHEGLGELGNEASPALKMLYHVLTNSDFRGLPITNANNPWYSEQRWDDYTKYVLHENEPIGIKNLLLGPKKGSKISTAESALGARQAPEFITDPEGYKEMMTKVNNNAYKRKENSDKKMKAQYQNDDE